MSMTYAELDSMILASIEAGRNAFGKMLVGDVAAECKRIATAQGTDQFDRVLDRRLQALRKGRKIMHQDGRWSVVNAISQVGPEEEARMRAFAKSTTV